MLTPRQSTLLTYIVSYQTEHRATPSMREMAAYLGVSSVSVAHRLIEELEGRRFIRTTPGKSRSIAVLRTEVGTAREIELTAELATARAEIERLGWLLARRAA